MQFASMQGNKFMDSLFLSSFHLQSFLVNTFSTSFERMNTLCQQNPNLTDQNYLDALPKEGKYTRTKFTVDYDSRNVCFHAWSAIVLAEELWREKLGLEFHAAYTSSSWNATWQVFP